MKKLCVFVLSSIVFVAEGCTVYTQTGKPPEPSQTVSAPPTAAPPAEPVAAAPTAAPPPPQSGVSASGAVSVSWGNWRSIGGETPRTTCVKESNAELCWDAVDNNCNGEIDEGCPYKGGQLQFIIAWRAAVDLDLHVAGPDGKETNWKQRDTGSLVLDQDCHGMKNGVDDCPNGKVENVYFPFDRPVARGHYKVWVEMFDSRGQKDSDVPFTFGAKAGVKVFTVPFHIANKPGTRKQFEFDVI